MTSRNAVIAVALAVTAGSVPVGAQQRDVDGANAVLPWALCSTSPRQATRTRPIPTRW